MMELQRIAWEILGCGKGREENGVKEVEPHMFEVFQGNHNIGNDHEVYCNSLIGGSNAISGFDGAWGLDNMFTGVPSWLESYK